MAWPLALLTAGSFASFTATFLGVRAALPPRRSIEFVNHAVSAAHAVLMIALGAALLESPSRALALVGGPTPDAVGAALSVSLGYFLYDLLCCLYIERVRNEPDLANSFHHTVCILGLVVGTFKGTSGVEILACIVISEVSTPFLHARFILKELGMNNTPVGVLSEILFALTFLTFRVVLGPVLTWATLASPTSHLVVKLSGFGVQAVSFVWFAKIVRIAMHKIRAGTNITPRHLKR